MFVVEQETKTKIQVELVKQERHQIELLSKDDFEFDWSAELAHTIVSLQLVETSEVIGLVSFEIVQEELRIEINTLELSKNNVGQNKTYDRIAGILISYVCKISFQYGFFGFVSLVPKTLLIDHYKQKYGFEQYGRQLAIDFDRSEYLIEEYLEKK